MPADLIWTIVAFILTLMIFSYVFGDNLMFRIATYLFVGVSAGYTAIMLLYQVILPHLLWPALQGGFLTVLAPLILSLFLIAKFFPRFSSLGNIPMGYVVGVAAAVVIGGAVLGTLFGQGQASINMFSLSVPIMSPQGMVQVLGAIFILIGTVCTLAYFNFGAVARRSVAATEPPHRAPVVELLARVGQIFIAITLGAVFAGIFAASITALIERLDFIKIAILHLIS